METYSIYLSTETEKYDYIRAAREAGATLTGVSGCGPGYYIQIDATPAQVEYIEKTWYRAELDALTAPEAWEAWKAGRLTVGQLATWQERHNVYFDQDGRERGRE
jgi:shikimate kinase